MRCHSIVQIGIASLAFTVLTACQPQTHNESQTEPEASQLVTLHLSGSLSEQYHQLADAYWQQRSALEPLLASRLGDNRYHAQFGEPLSEAYLKARHKLNLGYLAKLAALDWQQLEGEDQLSAKLLRYELEFALKDETFPSRFFPITPTHNPALMLAELARGQSSQPFHSKQDHQAFIARLGEFSTWVPTAIQRMEQGAEQGIVLPRLVVRQILAQLTPLLVKPLEQNPFYPPLNMLPAELTATEQQALLADYQGVLTQTLLPAIELLQSYLQQDYLPQARGSVGWQHLPNGKAWYQHLAEQHTTLPMPVERLHQQGLADVATLQAPLQSVQAQLGISGDLTSFFAQWRTTPSLSAKLAQAPLIPNSWAINSALPTFHQASQYSAFEFGYALYLQHLGWQSQAKDQPWSQLNLLLSQNLQALRLVVDTGLHAKGWSRAQSIQYLLDHSPMTRAEAETEVANVIATPGQALAYSVGLQHFLALQEQAQDALGQHFVVADFNQQLINAGALPLPLLQQKIQTWISQQGVGITD